MKTLTINSVQFQLVLKSFAAWLQTLSYSESAIKSYPNSVRELLHYSEIKGINQLTKLNNELIEQFIQHIQLRANERLGGGLSTSSINSIINGVTKFIEYLRLTNKIKINVELQRLKTITNERAILTKSEMNELFNYLDTVYHPIAKRNKAILACMYGAGLRKSEVVALNLEDVSLAKKIIHIKNGKGRKERLVPIAKKFNQMIKEYISECRDVFEGIAKETDTALFIDIDGQRIKPDAYYDIIGGIVKDSGISSLTEKRITPHCFRHSVATHLLQSGLELENIAQFLGHSSLDSTMIYTHIVEQLKLTSDE